MRSPARRRRAPGAPAPLRHRRRRRSAVRTFAPCARGGDSALALDMGGTSCDVCLIVGGEPLYSSDFEIEFGLPVSVPSVSTRTIGAGGGSIGWVDPGGFLQVGPQSAGASPGPGLLRPGRGARRRSPTRTSRSAASTRTSSSAGASARPGARAARRSARSAARLGFDRGRRCLGDGARLQREHGERDPHSHRRAGDGPARPRAHRLRRRRAHARVRDRGRARHQPGRSCRLQPGPLLRLRRARRAVRSTPSAASRSPT